MLQLRRLVQGNRGKDLRSLSKVKVLVHLFRLGNYWGFVILFSKGECSVQPQKINPQVLRLLVIFPNVMNYILAFGIGVFIFTSVDEMKAQGALSFWIIAFFAIIGVAMFTSISIFKRIRSGQI